MDSRLDEIEAKLSLAEDLLEELNRIVYRQDRQIARMQQELIALRQQVHESLPAEPRTPEEEVPPHY